ncbi:hypothetical protein GCM10011415_36290 [Salipiger pallidus]|uniref:Uncharacterized protein n=1 Tax=Salipiger pallidus TaxID=1775170 RepID=A0A8J2ZN88_9RHOB|nr:hypothetical protein GCM10011415_36290 [Salipiger pallidus]
MLRVSRPLFVDRAKIQRAARLAAQIREVAPPVAFLPSEGERSLVAGDSDVYAVFQIADLLVQGTPGVTVVIAPQGQRDGDVTGVEHHVRQVFEGGAGPFKHMAAEDRGGARGKDDARQKPPLRVLQRARVHPAGKGAPEDQRHYQPEQCQPQAHRDGTAQARVRLVAAHVEAWILDGRKLVSREGQHPPDAHGDRDGQGSARVRPDQPRPKGDPAKTRAQTP